MKVHQYDYYGGVEAESIESFIRKVTIYLRPFGQDSSDKSDEESFVGNIDSRIKLKIESPSEDDDRVTQLGGRSLTRVLDGFLASYVKKESETKHRCVECQKLFKGDDYVKKHLKTKHPELVKTITVDTMMFNAYILDHNKVDPIKTAPRDRSEGYNGNRPRDFSRNEGSYKTSG